MVTMGLDSLNLDGSSPMATNRHIFKKSSVPTATPHFDWEKIDSIQFKGFTLMVASFCLGDVQSREKRKICLGDVVWGGFLKSAIFQPRNRISIRQKNRSNPVSDSRNRGVRFP